jgi:hypothetical protein
LRPRTGGRDGVENDRCNETRTPLLKRSRLEDPLAAFSRGSILRAMPSLPVLAAQCRRLSGDDVGFVPGVTVVPRRGRRILIAIDDGPVHRA